MRIRLVGFLVLALIGVCLVSVILYNLPSVNERLAWRVENLRTQIRYALNPPDEIVFIPQAEVDAIVQATFRALTPTLIPSQIPSLTPTQQDIPATSQPEASATPLPSPTASPTPTPIPEVVMLTGIVHEYQSFNNCSPANLSMALSYWGWQGDQRDTRAYLRPNPDVDDKNVNPPEMVAYVKNHTNLDALVRVGGDLDVLKRLIAGGFPVIIEKGFQPANEDWMGHYEVISGYDEVRGRFITQDSYIMADFPLPYDQLGTRWWRDFNYVYLVVFPPDRENEVLSILGPHADEEANYQFAAQKASEETVTLSGRDLFFAWYNRGTSLVGSRDYAGAAQAYDTAFALYRSLPAEERPWRVFWYQTGPYPAYFHTGRYQDVINLANQTLSIFSTPILEEALYWRGLAKEGQGDIDGAVSDLKRVAGLNWNSTDVLEQLHRLGQEVP